MSTCLFQCGYLPVISVFFSVTYTCFFPTIIPHLFDFLHNFFVFCGANICLGFFLLLFLLSLLKSIFIFHLKTPMKNLKHVTHFWFPFFRGDMTENLRLCAVGCCVAGILGLRPKESYLSFFSFGPQVFVFLVYSHIMMECVLCYFLRKDVQEIKMLRLCVISRTMTLKMPTS